MKKDKRIRSIIVSFAISVILLPTTHVSANPPAEGTDAAPIYKRASSLLTSLPADFNNRSLAIIRNGWQDSDNDLEDLLAKNQDSINEFKKAADLTICQFTSGQPAKKDASTKPTDYSNEIKVAKLVLMQGRLREKESNPDSALEDYLSVFRFTNHLGQQKDFILLCKMVQMIVRGMACSSLHQYVQGGQLDAKNAQHLLGVLTSLRNQETGMEGAFEEEKEIAKNSLKMPATAARQMGIYVESIYRPMNDESDRLLDEFFGELIPAYRRNDLTAYEKKVDQFKKEVDEEAKPWNLTEMMLSGSAKLPSGVPPALVARILVSISIPTFSKVVTRYYASLAEYDVLITASALRVYELKNGGAPVDLQEFVPAYLPKLPEDPFDSFKPLKYERRKTGWVTYSIGPDRQDNNGDQPYDPNAPAGTGDIVFSLPGK